MSLDPKSLRKVADEAAADQSAKQEARFRRTKEEAAARFPALFAEFLNALERHVEAAAQSGSHSVGVLAGRYGGKIDTSRHDVRVPSGGTAKTHKAAEELLWRIVELNGGTVSENFSTRKPRMVTWRELVIDLDDFSKRVVDHFRAQGFLVEGSVFRYELEEREEVNYSGEVTVAW